MRLSTQAGVLITLVFSSVVVFAAEPARTERHVTVQGQGKVSAVPDQARLWIQVSEDGARVDAAVREIFGARARLSRALGWQIAGLIAGSSETWLALRWLGSPVGISDALVLESLTQAAKSVFFMIPSALGVQEAGLIGVGLLLGLGSDVALALSLAKRMREVLFGLPSLLAWQWTLGRRIFLQVRRRNEP